MFFFSANIHIIFNLRLYPSKNKKKYYCISFSAFLRYDKSLHLRSNSMKLIYSILFFVFSISGLMAQTGDNVFSFLRLPLSARANALGGTNLSLVERDPSLIFQNPALLGAEMDKMVNLNYLNYISDINGGSAVFTKAIGEKSAWGIGASFFSMGNMKGMTEDGISTGNFSAKDVAMMGFYSHDLSERWRGGATFKFIYSGIESYSSIGIAVDAGLSYYNSEKKFSFGFAFKNIGAQLKSYNDERQKMPWDIEMGISKGMAHAPFRFSLSAIYLNKWNFDYVSDDPEYKKDKFMKTFMKHLVFGVDWTPTENFWVGIGYNPKNTMDMKLKGGNAMAGFTGGAGVKIKMFDVGASVAKYHPSALSFMVSISTTLDDF